MSFQTRRRSTRSTSNLLDVSPKILAFKTSIGWAAVAHIHEVITKTKFGYPTKQSVLAQFDHLEFAGGHLSLFDKKIIERIKKYSVGDAVDFDDFDIDDTWMTPFQKSVTDACRDIPFGTTMSYGELAQAAGSPKAARAVGSVMSNNPFPLIVPCHRVVSSGAKLGGFSAPRGVSQKLQLLQLEGATNFSLGQS